MGQRKLVNHQVRFREAVAAAQRIAVVGVRPYALDEHLWGILARSAATLYYVGEKAAFEEWCAEFRCGGESVWLGPKFETAMDDLISIL